MVSKNSKTRRFLSAVSCLLMAAFLMGMFNISPIFSTTAFAQQQGEYRDPADYWLLANGRTNELDINATIMNETQYCHSCGKDTAVLAYRVPEYTKSGSTALNRNIGYVNPIRYFGRKLYTYFRAELHTRRVLSDLLRHNLQLRRLING